MGFGRMCHRSTVRQRVASPVRGEVRTELIHQPVGADHATVVDDSNASSARSFWARGVTSTPSITAESGPRTPKATSTRLILETRPRHVSVW